MKAKEKLNLTELSEIYLFSNTPMYLYRRFRKASSVYELASSFSAFDLLKQYNETVQSPHKTVEDVVVAYALLIAMSFKDSNDIRQWLDRIQTKGLDWASYIVQIIRDTSEAFQKVEIKIKPKMTVREV